MLEVFNEQKTDTYLLLNIFRDENLVALQPQDVGNNMEEELIQNR